MSIILETRSAPMPDSAMANLLDDALIRGEQDTALELIEEWQKTKQDLSAPNARGNTHLYEAIQRGYNEVALRLIEALTALKQRINTPTPSGETPLHRAAFFKNAAVFEALLEAMQVTGEDLSCTNANGLSPLHQALCYQHKEMVEKLVIAGADLDVEDHKGITPRSKMTLDEERRTQLHKAISQGDEEKALSLIESMSKYDILVPHKNKVTFLHDAVFYARHQLIHPLVEAGASIQEEPNPHLNLLYSAMFHLQNQHADVTSSINTCLRLIECGLSPSKKNANGVAPIDLVRNSYRKRALEMRMMAIGQGDGEGGALTKV